MKLTKTQLKQIIKEELALVLEKGFGQGTAPSGKFYKKQEIVLEEDGKGCAKSDKGCIRKRKGGWVILNNKKGGVWRKCDSHSHCESILDAMHASRG